MLKLAWLSQFCPRLFHFNRFGPGTGLCIKLWVVVELDGRCKESSHVKVGAIFASPDISRDS